MSSFSILPEGSWEYEKYLFMSVFSMTGLPRIGVKGPYSSFVPLSMPAPAKMVLLSM